MPRRRVESTKNQLVKDVMRLRERRERERRELFLVEGLREITRAAAAGVELVDLLIDPTLLSPAAAEAVAEFEEDGARVAELSPAAFARVSMRENPDGILAVARSWQNRLEGFEPGMDPLLLVVDGLEKPGNLGALLRTADAVGAKAVISTGSGTDPFNPNVVRASMGSVFSRPLISADTWEVLTFLKQKGVRTVATSPAARQSYWEADLTGPVAVVLGTEHEGLGPEWLEGADELVRIPMAGAADSLNVATAGALVLFEAVRQRSRRLH